MSSKYATNTQEAVSHLFTVFELNPYLSNYNWKIIGSDDAILLHATVHHAAIATLAESVAYGLYGNAYNIINSIEINPENIRLIPRPPLFQRMEELNTLTTIRIKYDLNQYTHSSRIDLDVMSGVVTLSGKVRDKITRYYAEELAYDTFGVDRLLNGLVIDPGTRQESRRLPSPYQKTPISNLKITLALSKRFSAFSLHISQEGDAVYLAGDVGDELTKKRLEKIASSVLGIDRVLTNGLSAKYALPT